MKQFFLQQLLIGVFLSTIQGTLNISKVTFYWVLREVRMRLVNVIFVTLTI